MRLQRLPDSGLPERKAVLICQNTRTSLERMEILVRAAIPGEARMPTVSWVSSLFSSSNPFQGPSWGCHSVSGKTRAQDHSSCHIWWNQSEKVPPLPVPLKTAAQGGRWVSRPTAPHHLWGSVGAPQPPGHPEAPAGDSASGSGVVGFLGISSSEASALFMEGMPTAKNSDRTCFGRGHGRAVGPAAA